MAKVDSGTSLGDLIGEEFGPYKLVRRLGVGGMAETFEAIRRGRSGFSQRVCLKLVLPFFRDNQDFVQLFEREARLAAKLRHRNIVGVIDFGEIQDTPYMALELVDGADLRVLLDAQDGTRLSHDYVALLGHELAEALEHAHNPPRGTGGDGSETHIDAIIHRDISPSNILISRQGEILLSDFGVAKAITGTSRRQSAVKGKIPYMSPEQLRAESLDGRSDLFALGVVLFEALAGQRPYEGAHDPAIIMSILNGDHPPLFELAPDAPPRLCEVIESLLEADREQRPENAAALIESLDEFAQSPRRRRELGKLVAEHCVATEAPISEERLAIGQSTTELGSEAPQESSGVQRSSGVPGAAWRARPSVPEAAPTHWSRRKVGSMIAASVLVIAALAAGAITGWPDDETGGGLGEDDTNAESEATGEDETSAALSGEDDATIDSLGADDPTGESAEATSEDSTPSTPVRVRPARLTVVVFPWGNVWINGNAWGAAPLKDESLKPGRYKISVGQGRPAKTQTVRLRSGQRKTIHFDLTD